MRVFSNRYLKAIYDKQLKIIVPSRLRKRLWLLLEANNFDFIVRPNPGDSWEVATDVITELMGDLRLAYGEKKLEARLPTGARGAVNSLKEFLKGAIHRKFSMWLRHSGIVCPAWTLRELLLSQ